MQSSDLCISSLRQQSFHFFLGMFFLEKKFAKFYRKKLIDMVDGIFMALRRRVWGRINLSPVRPFIRPDIDTCFVRLHCISSYSFGATALIFCRMFIHIMEVDLFIISYGQAGPGASFVSYRHTSFLENLS